MFEQAFKNIDDVLWKEAGCTTELDYTEQTSWLLFLKYLDDLEQEKATEEPQLLITCRGAAVSRGGVRAYCAPNQLLLLCCHDLPPFRSFFFNPKNNGPDHRVPVMERAMWERLW